jgi:lysyl-tRNA synthetase class 2
MIAEMRRYFDGLGYAEVETPMLQSLAGGAAARPFVTHMNALDIKLYMRIAPELYLKRLLVGGMPKVYEINRNFRNEGLDKQHNPEFTVVEAYEAFGDYHTMMELVEGLIRHLARFIAHQTGQDEQGLKLPFGDLSVDYGAPFRKVTYAALFKEALGFEMTDRQRCLEECKKRKLKHEGLDDILVVNELFEEVAEKLLDPAKPTFVMDYPSAISPLTRPSAANPVIAERWDLFIGGMEIGPAYTELNDPDIQESKFREQLKGLDDEKSAEENTFRTMDHDFLRALRVGMPPAGGMGLGIDRLAMLLTNQRTIRDVVLFPMMRPEE